MEFLHLAHDTYDGVLLRIVINFFSIKSKEFIFELTYYQLLKNNTSPRCYCEGIFTYFYCYITYNNSFTMSKFMKLL